jgi:hypothetical protein
MLSYCRIGICICKLYGQVPKIGQRNMQRSQLLISPTYMKMVHNRNWIFEAGATKPELISGFLNLSVYILLVDYYPMGWIFEFCETSSHLNLNIRTEVVRMGMRHFGTARRSMGTSPIQHRNPARKSSSEIQHPDLSK